MPSSQTSSFRRNLNRGEQQGVMPSFSASHSIPLSSTRSPHGSSEIHSVSLNYPVIPLYTFLSAHQLICLQHSLYIIYESIFTGFWKRPIPEILDICTLTCSLPAYYFLLSRPTLDRRVFLLLLSSGISIISIILWTFLYEFPFPSFVLDVIIPISLCCLLRINARTRNFISPYRCSTSESSVTSNALGCCLFLLYALVTFTIAVFSIIMILQASSFFIDYLSYASCFLFNLTLSFTTLVSAFHPIDRSSWLAPALLGMSMSYILTLTQWLRKDFYMPDVWLVTPLMIALFKPQGFLGKILLPHRRLQHSDFESISK